MKIMNVTTGYGYHKDSQGKIVRKYCLPIGQHPYKDKYTPVECTKEEFTQIKVWHPAPKPIPTEKERLLILLNDNDIKNKIKNLDV